MLRGFDILWSRDQGVDWQDPASLVVSTPRFLSAQRSAVSSLREEVAQRNPLEGVPLDSSRNKRDRGPSGTLGLPGTDILPAGSCFVLLSGCWSGVRQTCETRLGAKQISSGNFFARELRPLRWGPHPHRSPPARIFAEQKCLAAAKDCKFAARQSDR